MNNEMLNDPEFAEIIDIETEKVEKEYKFKHQYHKGLKIYVKGGDIFYGVEGVMSLVKRYNKLVDILNERNNNE